MAKADNRRSIPSSPKEMPPAALQDGVATEAPLIEAKLAPSEVFEAFPPAARAREMLQWAALTPENRASAGKRLKAVREWEGGTTAQTAQEVADEIGISRSRFYRMLSDWRRDPSVKALGVQAPKEGGRGVGAKKSSAHEAMQRHLPKVVAADKDARVSVLARRLKAVIALGGLKPPGETVLRAAVAREQRRLTTEGQAGNELLCDFIAVGIPGPGDIPHIMFVCLDRATGYIFGVGVGTLASSRAGFAAAASDALLRLDRQHPALPWGPSMARAQLTIGQDDDAWRELLESANRDVNANIQAKGGGKRYGIDIKKALGDSLGRIRLLAKQTGEVRPLRISVTSEIFDADEAKARIEAEVSHHNGEVLRRAGSGEGVPPPNLQLLLERLAGGE